MNLEIEPFLDILADKIADRIITKLSATDEYDHVGIQGIMNIFHCSRSKAQELKNSGILDSAIITHGRKFVIDKQKALECLSKGVH